MTRLIFKITPSVAENNLEWKEMVGIILGVWLNSVGEIVSLLEHCEQCNTEEGLEQ